MPKQQHHKQHSKKFSKIIKIGAAVILVGGSCGIIFGLTASLSNRQNFVDIKPWLFKEKDVIDANVAADYRSLPKETYWNSNADEPTTGNSKVYNDVYKASAIDSFDDPLTEDPFAIDSDITSDDLYDYAALIIDGSTHLALDKSFNQSTYQGIVNWVHQKDKALGEDPWKVGDSVRVPYDQLNDIVQTKYKDGSYFSRWLKPTGDDSNGFNDAYRAEVNRIKASKNHKGSLLLPGYLHETPLASFETRYKDLYNCATYTLLDGSYHSERCASVLYKSDQSAFLSGLAVCQYLQDRYYDVYSKVNNSKLAVGTFGGLPIPTVTSYMGGFEWGIYIYNKYILPKLAEIEQWDKATTEKRTVDLICVGKSDSFYSNSFLAGEAKLLVQQLLTQGADAILPVAGPQTMDVVKEIENQGSPTIAIGVDTDQENGDMSRYTSRSSLNRGDKIIQFSAQKSLSGISSIILQAQAKGIRGYYYSSDPLTKELKPQYLEYDGTALKEENEIIRNSFIGNSGYTTVASVYNKGATLSQGSGNVLPHHEQQSDNPLLQGTGWESLYNAVKLLASEDEHPENWESYDDIITFLLNKKFVDNKDGSQKIDVFQFLEENKYFNYE